MSKKIKNNVKNSLGFLTSLYDNVATYQDYLDRMTKICLSMFEWVNLPDSMDSRYLEECLFFDGQAALLKDDTFGFINTHVSDNGYINIYGLPTKLNCYSDSNVFQSYREKYSGLIKNPEDTSNYAILVMNNWRRVPTAATIQLFAERLTQAQLVCDVNINAQKTPIILLGDDKQKLTLENLYSQYDGSKPIIYGDKDLITNEAFKAINTQAPFVANDIVAYKKEIWNEFLSFIGVNTIDVEKKERLISGESSANNEFINLNLESYLEPRKKACEEFNKLYGTNISVRLRSDLNNLIKQNESIVSDYMDDGIINGSDGDLNE